MHVVVTDISAKVIGPPSNPWRSRIPASILKMTTTAWLLYISHNRNENMLKEIVIHGNKLVGKCFDFFKACWKQNSVLLISKRNDSNTWALLINSSIWWLILRHEIIGSFKKTDSLFSENWERTKCSSLANFNSTCKLPLTTGRDISLFQKPLIGPFDHFPGFLHVHFNSSHRRIVKCQIRS